MRTGSTSVRTVLVAGITLAAAALPAACGGSEPQATPTTASSVDHASGVLSVAAAKATAEREFGMLSGGNYGGAWELWTAGAQATVPKADFVSLGATCTAQRGVPYEVVSSRRINQYNVDITYTRAGTTGTSRLVFYSNAWHVKPDATVLNKYRAGRCA